MYTMSKSLGLQALLIYILVLNLQCGLTNMTTYIYQIWRTSCLCCHHIGGDFLKRLKIGINEMKLILKSRELKMLMGLKVHHDGFKPTDMFRVAKCVNLQ